MGERAEIHDVEELNADEWRMRVAGGWIYMLTVSWNHDGSPAVSAPVFVPDPTDPKVGVTDDRLAEAVRAAARAIDLNCGGKQDFDASEVAEIAVRAALEALGVEPPKRGFKFATESVPVSPDDYSVLNASSGIRAVEVERGAEVTAADMLESGHAPELRDGWTWAPTSSGEVLLLDPGDRVRGQFGINPDLPEAMARTAFIDAAEGQARAHGALP